jgi:hypothetical protein
MVVPKALARLIATRPPPLGFILRTPATRIPRSLPATLSRLANDGVGCAVRRRDWQENCWWEVTRVQLKDGGKHGRAWGRLWWNGMWNEDNDYCNIVLRLSKVDSRRPMRTIHPFPAACDIRGYRSH